MPGFWRWRSTRPHWRVAGPTLHGARQDGKVKNETVANLSHLPGELIEMIRASLAGQAFVPAATAATGVLSWPQLPRCSALPGPC
jgi:hypothetical protein